MSYDASLRYYGALGREACGAEPSATCLTTAVANTVSQGANGPKESSESAVLLLPKEQAVRYMPDRTCACLFVFLLPSRRCSSCTGGGRWLKLAMTHEPPTANLPCLFGPSGMSPRIMSSTRGCRGLQIGEQEADWRPGQADLCSGRGSEVKMELKLLSCDWRLAASGDWARAGSSRGRWRDGKHHETDAGSRPA